MVSTAVAGSFPLHMTAVEFAPTQRNRSEMEFDGIPNNNDHMSLSGPLYIQHHARLSVGSVLLSARPMRMCRHKIAFHLCEVIMRAMGCPAPFHFL
jgi:hypothetical protein